LSAAEKTFDIQFKQWEEQFNKWKEQNIDHPDKVSFHTYFNIDIFITTMESQKYDTPFYFKFCRLNIVNMKPSGIAGVNISCSVESR